MTQVIQMQLLYISFSSTLKVSFQYLTLFGKSCRQCCNVGDLFNNLQLWTHWCSGHKMPKTWWLVATLLTTLARKLGDSQSLRCPNHHSMLQTGQSGNLLHKVKVCEQIHNGPLHPQQSCGSWFCMQIRNYGPVCASSLWPHTCTVCQMNHLRICVCACDRSFFKFYPSKSINAAIKWMHGVKNGHYILISCLRFIVSTSTFVHVIRVHLN